MKRTRKQRERERRTAPLGLVLAAAAVPVHVQGIQESAVCMYVCMYALIDLVFYLFLLSGRRRERERAALILPLACLVLADRRQTKGHQAAASNAVDQPVCAAA